jgi:hypothetical protein
MRNFAVRFHKKAPDARIFLENEVKVTKLNIEKLEKDLQN